MLTKPPLLPMITPRDHSAETRARLDVLTEELSSGRVADAGRAVGSEFSTVSRVSHLLRTHDARAAALGQASTWLEVAQSALAVVSEAGDRVSSELVSALTPGSRAQIDGIARTALGALSDIASTLGQTMNGRAVFGNGDPSGEPLIDVDRMIAETSALAATATDVASLTQAFDAYFASGGGIDAGVLRSYPADPVRFPLGDGTAVEVPVSVGDASIRHALRQAALVAALPDVGFPIDADVRGRLTSDLVGRAGTAAAGLVATRADLGSTEERVSALSDQLADERMRLEARRSDALAADPFETATRLKDEMSRLETIYTVTARRSRLRLTDFLR
ncbi:flagellin [Jannaschia rubra]|uniref:Flagellar hook-associated protein FlgL n=1 Tax=Jannaschia rubra TaxID=282197 RepID=A0A0M6XST4_9RHOB|nr:flagellin [Jannaschia rubra]CTQ33637.1 flagellar hook-associated protein FlgL [Jannaschia rubra]SFG05417.1 flagellar hook-associated protein 3 FlgL [Jannaschia rubra]